MPGAYSILGATLIAVVIVSAGASNLIDNLPEGHPLRERKRLLCCQKSSPRQVDSIEMNSCEK